MKTVEQYREAFLDHLNSKLFVKEPRNLYEPMRNWVASVYALFLLSSLPIFLMPIITKLSTQLWL